MVCMLLSERASTDQIGGKAANLARVRALGMPVPETVVLPCQALRETLEIQGLAAPLQAYLKSFAGAERARAIVQHLDIAAAIRSAGLTDSARRDLHGAVGPLLQAAPLGLAVRSSAVYEDSKATSFAGVFESRIGVMDLDQVEQSVLDCWISSWAPRALRYLEHRGLAPRADGMAVMIQPVVPATASGVIYTADPDTGNPWQFVVQATPGLSLDLLGGSGVGDSYRVEWDTGSIIERRIEPKSSWAEATPDGVRRHSLHGAAATRPALSDAEVTTLAERVRRLDETFGLRLDVEFVFAEEDLWIVQARPLTALPVFFPHKLDEEDRARSWQRAQFVVPLRADTPPGFLTPLYRDLSDAELWFRYQPDDIVLTALCKETRDVNGYRYIAAEPLPIFTDFFADPSGYEAWLDANEPRYRKRWERHLDELGQIATNAQSALRDANSAAELIPALFQVRDHFWDLNAFGWSGPQSFGWMCGMLLDHFVKEIDADLESTPAVSGGSDSYTFQVTQQLQELGRAIHEPQVRRAFDTLGLHEIVAHLRRVEPDCDFLGAFEAFCWRFGKTPPSWRDRPGFWSLGDDETSLMHTVRSAFRGQSRDVREAQRVSRLARDEHEQLLRNRIVALAPDLVARFEKILAWARFWGKALNDRHGLTIGILWERELIWQVGQRLCGESILEKPEEVLMLHRADLEAFVAGGSSSALRTLAHERRREMSRQLRLEAPDTIGGAPPPVTATEDATMEEPPGGGNCFAGTGIGSSTAVGVARKVPDLSDPGLLDGLGPDDILVLPYTYAFHYADWHSLLMLVKGVVSPGRPSHHLAQVARECGVPVIGHIMQDLSHIEDGTRLYLDARAGTVQVLE